MGERRPIRNSPPSRLIGLPSLHSFASGNAGMRPDQFAASSTGLSQVPGMSPTLDRRFQDRSFPSLTNSTSDPMYTGANASIRIRMLPRNFNVASLRNILIFSKDLRDCYFINSEDDGHLSAIATFGSPAEAHDAQDRLNGKALPDNGANMIVEVSYSEDQSASRRNTIDGTAARHQSASASSSASSSNNHIHGGNGNPLIRHNSRYSFNYTTMQDSSPPLRSPDTTTRLQNLFSPTSPVANGISGNSLRHDEIGDDETGQLLDETLPHARNGYYPRHATTSGALDTSFKGLSLSTNLTNGYSHSSGLVSPIESGMVSPRMYSAVQSPSATTPSAGGAQSGGWEFNRPRQSMPPANPADQNPPCNTLYVGNLPPNTCEDELKTLFSRQRGYKRLCFRTKHNGPMCFVEFDDINYAAQSLDNLYGTMLTNSVKGGIRLSFSKNPLGVRREGLNSPSSPLTPHPMGSVGINSGGAAFATAHGHPPGLPVPLPRAYPNSGSGNATRAFNNGNTGTAPPVRSLPSPGGYYGPSLNGHFAGMSDARPHMFGAYQNQTNGSFGGMTNGA